MSWFKLCAFMLLTTALLLGAPRAAHAARSYANCAGFITTLPATIVSSGTWCFNQNLSTSATAGIAVTIGADNVTLDCNDFKLDGLAAGASTTNIGVSAQDRLNVTVRHCKIRGFFKGLLFTGSLGGGHVVEDSRFDGNTHIGIEVAGDGSVVRRNRVFDTGGSLQDASALGIQSYNSVDVLGNTVSGVVATPGTGFNPNAFGITASNASGGSIDGNRIRGVVKDGTGVAVAIASIASGRVVFRGNDLVGDASVGSIGLLCNDANSRAKDNVISGFATAINSCSNSNGNVIRP